jgi:hypothetical protein
MHSTYRQTHSAKILVPTITRALALVLSLASFASTGLAQSCVAPPTGLIAWWPGNDNFLSFAGAPPLEPHGGISFAPGESNSAFSLDGSSGYLQWLSPNSLPLGNQPRTVALWFCTTQQLSQNTESALIQYGNEANGSMFGLITSGNAPGRLYFFGYNYDLAGTTVLLPNTWYFGVVTFDGTTLRLYVNGQQENSMDAPGLNTQLNANGLTVGLRSPGTRWTGQLDEVAIWNRALTASEVQAIYTAGSAGMCPPAQSTPPAYASQFNAGDDGWTVVNWDGTETPLAPTWLATGGNSGGYVWCDDEFGDGFWRAPASFHGDWSDLYGGTLSYDMFVGVNPDWKMNDIYIVGNGQTLSYWFPTNPTNQWGNFTVSLDAAAGWQYGLNYDTIGTNASEAQIRSVLSSVTDIRIREEYAYGTDSTGLDNVIVQVAGGTAPRPIIGGLSLASGVVTLSVKRLVINQAYALQSQSGLGPSSSWQPALTFMATNYAQSVSVPATDAASFFRVISQ